MPNCDKCSVFSECPVYSGTGKGNPDGECPFIKLIKAQR